MEISRLGPQTHELKLCRAMQSPRNGQAYQEAKPDPIASFAPAVAGHMNADHSEATVAMIRPGQGSEATI